MKALYCYYVSLLKETRNNSYRENRQASHSLFLPIFIIVLFLTNGIYISQLFCFTAIVRMEWNMQNLNKQLHSMCFCVILHTSWSLRLSFLLMSFLAQKNLQLWGKQLANVEIKSLVFQEQNSWVSFQNLSMAEGRGRNEFSGKYLHYLPTWSSPL